MIINLIKYFLAAIWSSISQPWSLAYLRGLVFFTKAIYLACRSLCQILIVHLNAKMFTCVICIKLKYKIISCVPGHRYTEEFKFRVI